MGFTLWNAALDVIVSPADMALDLVGPLLPAALIAAAVVAVVLVVRKRRK